MKIKNEDLDLVSYLARENLLNMPGSVQLGRGPLPMTDQQRMAMVYIKSVLSLLNKHGMLIEGWREKVDYNINVSDSEPETEY